jgi:5-methyltetrahydrofolate--homocysteine methyltransferase
MDDVGIPDDPEARVAIADRVLNRAAQMGIPAEDVVIDPLVMAVGADSRAASATLRAIERVRQAFGVNVNLGASNVSFGLPDRYTLNQVFLAMAIGAGATCAITDPMKLTATARAADLLAGRDAYARRYLKYYRAHPVDRA